MRRRAAALLVLGLAALSGLSACGGSGVTQPKVQAAVASTFARLWVLQQGWQGHPRPTVASLQTRASCNRGSPAKPAKGAGNDWVCNVVWLVDGPNTPVTAIYNLNVRTDACYTADGDGPATVNGARTLVDPRGRTVVNPLWAFDGCFDPG